MKTYGKVYRTISYMGEIIYYERGGTYTLPSYISRSHYTKLSTARAAIERYHKVKTSKKK